MAANNKIEKKITRVYFLNAGADVEVLEMSSSHLTVRHSAQSFFSRGITSQRGAPASAVSRQRTQGEQDGRG
jgi:hypothetical protein